MRDAGGRCATAAKTPAHLPTATCPLTAAPVALKWLSLLSLPVASRHSGRSALRRRTARWAHVHSCQLGPIDDLGTTPSSRYMNVFVVEQVPFGVTVAGLLLAICHPVLSAHGGHRDATRRGRHKIKLDAVSLLGWPNIVANPTTACLHGAYTKSRCASCRQLYGHMSCAQFPSVSPAHVLASMWRYDLRMPTHKH